MRSRNCWSNEAVALDPIHRTELRSLYDCLVGFVAAIVDPAVGWRCDKIEHFDRFGSSIGETVTYAVVELLRTSPIRMMEGSLRCQNVEAAQIGHVARTALGLCKRRSVERTQHATYSIGLDRRSRLSSINALGSENWNFFSKNFFEN